MKNFLLMITVFLSLERGYTQSQDKDFPKSFAVSIANPLNVPRENVLVTITPQQWKKKAKEFNHHAFIVLDGKNEIASQYNANDSDHDGIVFVVDNLGPLETKTVLIRYHPTATISRTYAKRTQAELSHKTGGEWKNREYIAGEFKNVSHLSVPPEHKDHSWFIRYEGPGWESDKVGYRFYLDQRNATDVFGKKLPDVMLQQVGLDGFDSYHNMQPWGMDVMKVGKSLGVGSIGTMVNNKAIRVEKTDSVNCRITENGTVYSSIFTNYYGWQVGNKKHHVESRISIHAGTRLSHQRLTISGNPENICTGIVKDKNGKLITSKGDMNSWGYLATYGKQSLNSDELGLAVLFNPNNAIDFTSDEFSDIIALKPTQGNIEYYFLGAWVQEPGGIKDEKQFIEYLNSVAQALAKPVKVEIKN